MSAPDTCLPMSLARMSAASPGKAGKSALDLHVTEFDKQLFSARRGIEAGRSADCNAASQPARHLEGRNSSG